MSALKNGTLCLTLPVSAVFCFSGTREVGCSFSCTAMGQGPQSRPLRWGAEHQEGPSMQGEVSFPRLAQQTPWGSPVPAVRVSGRKHGRSGGAEGGTLSRRLQGTGRQCQLVVCTEVVYRKGQTKRKAASALHCKKPIPSPGRNQGLLPMQSKAGCFCLPVSFTHSMFFKAGLILGR